VRRSGLVDARRSHQIGQFGPAASQAAAEPE
jgi:hypothetical protein